MSSSFSGPHVRQALASIGRGSVGIVSQNVLNLATLLYLWHALDVGSYGEVALALGASIQACQFVRWGMDPLLTRELVRASAEDARRLLASLLRQKQVAALVVVAMGLLLAALPSVPGGPLLIYLGLVDGAILGFTAPPAFDSRGRYPTYLAIAHLRPVTYLAGLVALDAFAPEWFVPRVILLVHAVALVPAILLEWRWIRRHWGPLDPAGAGARGARLWVLALPVAAGEAAVQAGNALSPWAAQWLGQPREAVGHLAASNQLTVAMASLAVVPAAVLHAQLAADPSPRSRAFVRRIVTVTIVLAVAAVACASLASVVAGLVAPHVPERYASALALFRIDAWRFVGPLGGAALTSALICQHRVRTQAACQVLGLAVSAVAALVLVPRLGVVGAAAALVCGRVAFLLAGLGAVIATTRDTDVDAAAAGL